MPNWITNKISAPKHVIEAMLDDDGRIDFRKILPFKGQNTGWDLIYGDAETAAKFVLGVPLHENPLIAMFGAENRKNVNISKMSEESFRQFIGMLESYRSCGYLHEMDFARKEWGTKWNACDQKVNSEDGYAEFDTAWTCPIPVFESLSRIFPDDEIRVIFADEDIGSNCGALTFKGGVIIQSDVAPAWKDMDRIEKEKWRAFAYEVKGWEPEEEDDD